MIISILMANQSAKDNNFKETKLMHMHNRYGIIPAAMPKTD